MRTSFKRFLLAAMLAVSVLSPAQENAEDFLYEAVEINLMFNRNLGYSFSSYYREPNLLYLPVSEFFETVKVPISTSSDGQVLKGFFETEANSFEFNLSTKKITYNKKEWEIEDGDVYMDVGILYMNTKTFEKVFGFTMAFDSRTLSIRFSSPFEMPLVKLMALEKKRELLRKEGGEGAVYDSILSRKYHWYKGNMMDWSFSLNQASDGLSSNHFALGLGAEVLGGETNLRLNYNTIDGFVRNQQDYSWRWADNRSDWLRQVVVGRVRPNAIATLYSPVDGVTVTNARTTVRKALGSYRLDGYIEPDWVVELYINNQLMTYTTADANGLYVFDVPIVYGTSRITLRFYGPNGEIRTEEREFSMPFNMLPKGEVEYVATAGYTLDSLSSRFGKAQVNVGLARFLTAGFGLEYLSSIASRPAMPFMNFTFQPYSKLLLLGEYVHKVKSKVSMMYSFPKNISLDANWSFYDPNQEAIVYNYLQERTVGLSVPYKIRNLSNSIRTSVRQNVYEDMTYTSGEVMMMSSYKTHQLIFSNYFNFTSASSFNAYGNLTYGTKIFKNVGFRLGGQFNYATKSLLALRAELDTRLFSNGYLGLKLENNAMTDNFMANVSFRYTFPFMSSNISASISKDRVQFSEGASGSFAFNTGGKYVHVDKVNAVGRSGLSILPFIDMNFNGKWDKHEPASKGIKVRCNGGLILNREQDSIIRVVGLEPFVDYTLIFDESGFDNVALRAKIKNMKFTSDPNQFKKLYLPIQPMAEIYGQVADENGRGIGRIIVHFIDDKGAKVAKVLTESDGYFNYIGFKPGNYKVEIDSLQLNILKYQATPSFVTVLENADGDVVDAGTIQLVKKRVMVKRKVQKLVDGVWTEVEEEVPEDQIVVEQPTVEEVDSLPNYSIYFAVDKSEVRKEYIGPLKSLADYLKRPSRDTIRIEIIGHTDSDASDDYNMRLSMWRAKAVKQYLMLLGVKEKRMIVRAEGERGALNANRTPEEKAANRRVVFQKATPQSKETKLSDKVMNEPDSETMQKQKPVLPKVTEAITPPMSVKTFRENTEGFILYEKNGKFFLNMGSFRKGYNAQQFANELRSILPGKVVVIQESGLHKVQLGYFNSRLEAVRAANTLKSRGLLR